MQPKTKTRSANSVLAVATLSHSMQHIFVGTSILFPLIIADLKLNYTEFGLAVAVSTLIGGLSQIFFGVVSRRIARYVLLGLGNILLSLGTFISGLSQRLPDFLGARIVSNVGVGPQHTMGTAIISEKFDGKSLGKAIGIHYGAAYVGNIIGPLFMTFLAVLVGWRNTLFVFSVPALFTGSFVIWYLTETRHVAISKTERKSTLKSDILTLLKTKSVVAIILSQVFLSGGVDLGIITTYTPIFLADGLHLDIGTRGIIYTIGLAGGVIGPILLGRYADKRGHLKVAVFSSAMALVLVYLLSLYDVSNIVLAVHLFILGFTSFALPTVLQSHLVKVTRQYERDLVVGLFFTVNFAFSSLWTGVMGYIIDAYGSFKPAFLLMGTLGIIALIILARQMKNTKEEQENA